MATSVLSWEYRQQRAAEEHAFCMSTGLGFSRDLARGLMAHFGADPAEHPAAFDELERTAAEELIDLARQILHEHGISTDEAAMPHATPAQVQP